MKLDEDDIKNLTAVLDEMRIRSEYFPEQLQYMDLKFEIERTWPADEMEHLQEHLLALDDCVCRLGQLLFTTAVFFSIANQGEQENTVFTRLVENRRKWEKAFADGMNRLLIDNMDPSAQQLKPTAMVPYPPAKKGTVRKTTVKKKTGKGEN